MFHKCRQDNEKPSNATHAKSENEETRQCLKRLDLKASDNVVPWPASALVLVVLVLASIGQSSWSSGCLQALVHQGIGWPHWLAVACWVSDIEWKQTSVTLTWCHIRKRKWLHDQMLLSLSTRTLIVYHFVAEETSDWAPSPSEKFPSLEQGPQKLPWQVPHACLAHCAKRCQGWQCVSPS